MTLAEPSLPPAQATTAAPARTPFRGDIQGLRALAVGVVVLSHAGLAGFEGGYVGVDVFFVISGFLITGILTRELAANGRISILDFYARRARRILPAAAVVLLAITVFSWFAFGYVRLSQILQDTVWAGLFGANIHFARADTDYFAQDSFVSPVQHFWSLAVEEQFYLLWPVLIAVVAVLARRRPRRAVALVLGGLVVASFAWSVFRTGDAPTSAYYSTFTRAWELGVGALLALGARYLHQLTRGFLAVLSWVGLGLIAWSVLTYTSATPFPGSAAAVPVIGSALVIAGGLRPTSRGASRLLDRAPMRWLGDLSYSLYLVHWPVLVIPAMATGEDLTGMQRTLLVALSVAVAGICHDYVEVPIRDGVRWQQQRARALALWPAAIALVLGAVFAAGSTTTGTATAERPDLDLQNSSSRSAQERSKAEDAHRSQRDANARKVLSAVRAAAAQARSSEPIPRALTPSPQKLQEANWSLPKGCVAGTSATKHRICSFGDTRAERTVLLYGDSHMGMWVAPISAAAKASGWKVVVLVKTGCPPFDVPMWRTERSDRYTECDWYRKWAAKRIETIAPDRIVVAGYTRTGLADPGKDRPLPDGDGAAGTRAVGKGMLPVLQRLRTVTPDVTVLADTRTSDEMAVDCVTARGATLKTCAGPIDPVTVARNAAWKRAADKAGARFVDVDRWLCSGGTCPVVVGNVIVYTDRHHVTRTFARALQPLLGKALRL